MEYLRHFIIFVFCKTVHWGQLLYMGQVSMPSSAIACDPFTWFFSPIISTFSVENYFLEEEWQQHLVKGWEKRETSGIDEHIFNGISKLERFTNDLFLEKANSAISEEFYFLN